MPPAGVCRADWPIRWPAGAIRASYGKSFEFVNAQFYLGTSVAPPWGSDVRINSPSGGLDNPFVGSGQTNIFPVTFDRNAPFSLNGPFISLSDDMTSTSVHLWNVTVERQIGSLWASAAYVGSRTNNIWESTPLNNALFVTVNGAAPIQQGYRVIYREAHTLLEELADATLDGTRKVYLADLGAVPLLIIDDLGMRKLPHTAAEDLLEVIMRRYERTSTLLTSNRPVDDWGKLLGDTAAVTALLDRLLHHAHVLKCGPKSWRTKIQADLRAEDATK